MERFSRKTMLLGAVVLMGGCTDYIDRRDSVSFGAGNAMEANIAIQTIDPFPVHRNTTEIRTDGKVAARVQQAHVSGSDSESSSSDDGEQASDE
ncbi:hypothetical protein [Consotaella aegiceratis]|uniref:hypothetical protein n=1 Tax=Consotaella aegiceratis TaxID=3097961 RepID=UPI002F408411